MNFAITPNRIPAKDIIASVKNGRKDLEKNEIRERVCPVIKNTNCHRNQNLFRSKEKAWRLENAVVVMNRTDYHKTRYEST